MKKHKWPIDLSMLTDVEVAQFEADSWVLFHGDTDVCLYLRFSNEKQKEQSIEGQLRDCIAFCKRNNYRIVAIYVDRAKSARVKVTKRISFQQMVSDSENGFWDYVVVWQLDRFARNRHDSAVYKARLRQNNVKVLSATEVISDQPEGIILEAVLEGMAEYYSAELSKKVTRGMKESAIKGMSVGGVLPLGYKIENKRYVIDPVTAPIAQEAFSLYANGATVADICATFNARGYRTVKGEEFNKNSFHRMFRNERYIGVYQHGDVRHESGVMPQLISREVWDKVQERLHEVDQAPARGKAKVDYLLSGKLFCGHCQDTMVGESGTSRRGQVYYYYSCTSHKRRKGCDKKPVRKDWLEEVVARDALALLTDEVIEKIADIAIRQSELDIKQNTMIPALEEELKETTTAINNIISMVEKGVASTALAIRLNELEKKQKTLARDLEHEKKSAFIIDKYQVIYWLNHFKSGDIDDPSFRRQLVALLVNSVTVWDEPDGWFTITSVYNLLSTTKKTVKLKMSTPPIPTGLLPGSDMESKGSPSKRSLKALMFSVFRDFSFYSVFVFTFDMKNLPRMVCSVPAKIEQTSEGVRRCLRSFGFFFFTAFAAFYWRSPLPGSSTTPSGTENATCCCRYALCTVWERWEYFFSLRWSRTPLPCSFWLGPLRPLRRSGECHFFTRRPLGPRSGTTAPCR